MVERPIKKSERQALASTPPEQTQPHEPVIKKGPEANDFPATDRKERRPRKDKGDKGKDRGDRHREERAPVNMALVRGPRPAKAKSPVEEVVPTEDEATSAPEAESETATEVTA